MIFDIKKLLLKCSSHSYPQPLLFSSPRLRTLNTQVLLWGQGTCWWFFTRASQMHNSPIWDSVYFSPCPETNLSASLVTLSIYSKALMGAKWVKRRNFKYPNVMHYLTCGHILFSGGRRCDWLMLCLPLLPGVHSHPLLYSAGRGTGESGPRERNLS